MSGLVLGYYIYSTKDSHLVADVAKLVREQSAEMVTVTCQRALPAPELVQSDSFAAYRIEQRPLGAILFVQAVSSPSAFKQTIEAWEDILEPHMLDFLGCSYVAAGFEDVAESLVALPRTRQTYKLNFSVREHEGLRDGWRWTDGQANYAFLNVDNKFLLRELPLVEIASRRTELLRRYYHDQVKTIKTEKNEIEQELSKILYSTLVPANRQEEAGHLEEDMMNISKGYGVLTSNHRVVREGLTKIKEQMAVLEKAVNVKDFAADNDFLDVMLEPYRSFIAEYESLATDLAEARENQRAGMEVVRGKIDVLMSKESLNLQNRVMEVMEVSNKMQKQSLTFQVAASLIEFVILAYYGLSLWKYLDETGYHGVPGWMAAVLILTFAGDVTFLTHLVAERIQGEEGLVCKTIIAVVLLVGVISLMIWGHLLFGGHGAPVH